MCDIWGSIDQVRDTFVQRSSGDACVVINVYGWWSEFGSDGFDKFDVSAKMFVSAGGAVLFANVGPYIATVLPLSVVSKIMMSHPANEEFVRRVQEVQDRDDSEYGRNRNPSKL
jgi:hypothetical protein